MTVTAPASPGVAARLDRVPWWARVLVLFAAARVVTTLLHLWVQTQVTWESRSGADPSLLELLTQWDGQWYWLIAEQGYPGVLPTTADGVVDTNQWAFLPVYPVLADWLRLGVLDWRVAAVALSVASGAAAAVLLAALLLPRIGRSAAVFASALFSFAPLSFVLQWAYAEALGLALLLGALLLVERRRYLWAILPTALLAFTRPGALVLALTVGVVLVVRFARSRRDGPPLPARELAAGALLAAVAAALGFAWSAVAAAATGRPDAYFATEGAWRLLWMPHADIVLFEPWWFAAEFWVERVLGAPAAPSIVALVLVVVVGGFAAFLLTRRVRRLGLVAAVWCASYALYLLAVFFPQSSTFRLLMPMAPLAGALVPRSPAARVLLLALCTALQALWLWVVVGPVQDFWTVP